VLHKITAEARASASSILAANETVMRGLGEMHLRTVLEKMSSQYKLDLDTRPPSIPYRETIAAKAEGHSATEADGRRPVRRGVLKSGATPRGSGFEFVDSVKGGAIPNQFIPSVEKGVRSVLDTGYIAGFPLQDVRVIVYDGKSHPVDSKDVAFMSAGRKAFLDALAKARPVVLEPIVNVDIIAPETKMGDIAGELSGHPGRIKGSDTPRPGTVQISAQAPLSELEHFPARLKSLTAGHGRTAWNSGALRAGAAQLQRSSSPLTAGRTKTELRHALLQPRPRYAPARVRHGFTCDTSDWRFQ